MIGNFVHSLDKKKTGSIDFTDLEMFLRDNGISSAEIPAITGQLGQLDSKVTCESLIRYFAD